MLETPQTIAAPTTSGTARPPSFGRDAATPASPATGRRSQAFTPSVGTAGGAPCGEAPSDGRSGAIRRATAGAVPAAASLEARLSARISSSLDEVVAFASPARAIAAVARVLLAGRSVAIGDGTPDDLARAAARAARTTTRAPWLEAWLEARQDGVLAALLEGSADAEALVLGSPVVARNGGTAAIAPRELLRLRARNLRSLLILDLRDEDLARTPLTPTALLLPGTIAIRGFGEVWREAGAPEVADLAFVAGPAREIAMLRSEALGDDEADRAIIGAACAALDRSDIDRRVREVAAAWRGRTMP